MLRKFFKEAAIYGIADFIAKFITFASFPWYTRALTVEQFGVFALVITLGALLALFFNCGLNNAVQRVYLDPKTEKNECPVIVTTGLFCLLGFSLIVCLLFLTLGYPYRHILLEQHQISWNMVLIGLLSTILLQLNVYCLDVLRVNFQPWKFTSLTLIQNITTVVSSLIFVIGFGWGVIGYLGGLSLGYALTLPFSLWLIRSNLTWQFEFKLAKELVKFGYPFIFAGLAFWLYGSMDRWMLAELSTNTQVGLYSLAFKLATVLIFLNTTFATAWSPFAFKSHRNDPNYKEHFSTLFVLWWYALIFAATALSLFSPEILFILTPPDYWPAAMIVPYIAFGLALTGAGQVVGIGISLKNRTVHFTYASWITAFINLTMNYFFIPVWGAEGAAIATLFSNGVLFFYYYLISQKLHPLPLNLKKVAFCGIMTLIPLYFSYYFLRQPVSHALIFSKLTVLAVMAIVGFALNINSVEKLFGLLRSKQKAESIG